MDNVNKSLGMLITEMLGSLNINILAIKSKSESPQDQEVSIGVPSKPSIFTFVPVVRKLPFESIITEEERSGALTGEPNKRVFFARPIVRHASSSDRLKCVIAACGHERMNEDFLTLVWLPKLNLSLDDMLSLPTYYSCMKVFSKLNFNVPEETARKIVLSTAGAIEPVLSALREKIDKKLEQATENIPHLEYYDTRNQEKPHTDFRRTEVKVLAQLPGEAKKDERSRPEKGYDQNVAFNVV
ncbi:hypothetical protein D9C73_019848 [Collichthys lucidus]|uniref:Uncharacterized protein n=1 Tax=Collichthys lucidus TaxID=240159 RepID=A0A4U5VBR3_COLLU|nr:hypothetical protein D9C73_019848 [Collichthys lucidus]